MSDLERPRRKNGLSPPYTAAQVSTWVYLPVLTLEFLFFATPLLPLAASIPCSLLLCGLAAASAHFAVSAMMIDPADPRLDGASDQHGGHCAWDPQEPTKQCWICDVQVGHKSMHCKFCNKCVDHFDHHCMWLNTCVGKANYPYFFRTMITITSLLVVHGATQLVLVIDIFAGFGSSESRSEEWFNADASLAIVVVICTFLVADLVALSLIGQLLLFHLRLRKEGLSTYEFIVRDNQRRREQTKLENELSHKRQVAMARAREEGRTCDLFHLRIGGQCRAICGISSCDPLQSHDRKGGMEGPDRTLGNGRSNGNHNGASTRQGGEGESKEQEEP